MIEIILSAVMQGFVSGVTYFASEFILRNLWANKNTK
nr:MAG TPA: hypothetical protein [Caudoviricetes sp.]